MDSIKIFLADDHAIMREGLTLILGNEPDFEIVGESGDGMETCEMVEKVKPDVLILDISMPTISGIEAARRLKKYIPETKILVLSRHDNETYVNQLLECGISGYMLKDDVGDDLIRAVRAVFEGKIYLSPAITTGFVLNYLSLKKNISGNERKTADDPLTPREREVLKLIAEGNDNARIGLILRISTKTVKSHRLNIMKKLDIHKVNDLVLYAVRNGFVEI